MCTQQVFTSKDGKGVSRTQQAKDLLAQYGSAYLLTSISFAIVSFSACYALVNAGEPRTPRRQHVHPVACCLDMPLAVVAARGWPMPRLP